MYIERVQYKKEKVGLQVRGNKEEERKENKDGETEKKESRTERKKEGKFLLLGFVQNVYKVTFKLN
jgi:hypothetical protein